MMVRVLRLWGFLPIVVFFLGACGVALSPPASPTGSLAQEAAASASASPGPSVSETRAAPPTVRDTANGISFERPVAWTRWQPNRHNPINDGPLIYLSVQPLSLRCAVAVDASPNPPDERGRACDLPLSSLPPNGVFVEWRTTRILEPLPTTGETIQVNGSSTRLQIDRPGSCFGMKADEVMDVLVPIGQPTPLSNVAVVACMNGPDLAGPEAQVRAMLASATLR
jgi:hypothetical protein